MAPAGTVYAYLTVVCGDGAPGTLRFDDAELRYIATRNQDFDQWINFYNFKVDGTHTWDDWMISTGKITRYLGYIYSASLPYSSGSTNFIRSALLPEGLGEISFLYQNAGETPTAPVSFIVQKSYDNNTWTTLDTVTNIEMTTDYLQYKSYQYDTTPCYVRIVHHGGSANRLLIDDIAIALPTPVQRYQDFNDWPDWTDNSCYETGNWKLCVGRINSVDSRNGKAAEIFYSPESNNYVRSPQFSGIGTISFWYRRGTNGASPLNFTLQISTNGTIWESIDTVTNVSSTNYQYYSKYMYDTRNLYVRIRHDTGTNTLLIDEIEIGAPTPLAYVIIYKGGHVPLAPVTNESVKIWANAYSFLGATGLTLTAYYRIGTNGAFTASGMERTDPYTYFMTNSIPPQNSGAEVQYYIRCDFGGLGSESNTPTYYPEGGPTNPLSYRIPRNRKGLVWINELNYVNGGWNDIHEFVEICGPSGFDVSGWKMEFYIKVDVDIACYASYTIPNNTFLSSNASGYGFYVFGDQELPAANQQFIHTNNVWWDGYSTSSQISDGYVPSGISLINEGNDIEHSLAYGGSISGFPDLGAEDMADPYSLQLAGSGAGYTNFAWRINSMTPGAINVDQCFGSGPNPPETNAAVEMETISCAATQITITATFTNAACWTPDAQYVTNLLLNPLTWDLITNRTITITNNLFPSNTGLWQIQFAYPPGLSHGYFRVKAKP